MRGLRAISSFSVALIAATIVSGLPCGCGSVANSADVGSTSGEKTKSAAVAGSGFGARSASSAAWLTSRSTDASDVGQILVGGQALALQELPHPPQRIAARFRFALRRRLVQPLVVRERVRVRPDDRRVHQHRALALARVRHRLAHRAVAGEVVGAVAAEDAQAGKPSTTREMSPPGVCTSTGTEIA